MQQRERLRPVPSHGGCPLGQRVTAALKCQRDISRRQFRLPLKSSGQPLGAQAQLLRRVSRHDQHHGSIARVRSPRLLHVLLHHQVSVGAGEAEGAQHCAARGLAPPLTVLGPDRERGAGEIEVPVGGGEMQGRDQLPVLQAHHYLLQPSDPGRGGGVAQVGLHRAHGAETGVGGPAPERASKGSQLDRVAEDRARAVQLSVGDRPRIDRLPLVHLLGQSAL